MTLSRALYVNMRTVHNPQFLANYLLFSLLYNIMVSYHNNIPGEMCGINFWKHKVDELPLISRVRSFSKQTQRSKQDLLHRS